MFLILLIISTLTQFLLHMIDNAITNPVYFKHIETNL